MIFELLSKFLLILLTIVFLNTSKAAETCSIYFKTSHALSTSLTPPQFDSLLDVAQFHYNDPHFWIETIRYLNEDTESFPYAKHARFGTYFKSQGFKNPKYQRHLFSWTLFRGSHIDLPQEAPQNKKDLAEFLVHFAYALELQLSNRNSFSFPVETSFTYLKVRRTLELRRSHRLNKITQLIEKSSTPRTQKTLLHMYLIYSKVKSLLKIQALETELLSRFASMFPFTYALDVNFILKSYDRDIQRLTEKLKLLTEHEVILSSRPTKEKSALLYVFKGVARFFLQPIWQFTFWEPLSSRTPQKNPQSYTQPLPWWHPTATTVASNAKYFVDTAMIFARASVYILGMTIVTQSVHEVLFLREFQLYVQQHQQDIRQQLLAAQTLPPDTEALYRGHIEHLKETLRKETEELTTIQDPHQQKKREEDLAALQQMISEAEARLEQWKHPHITPSS